jgi:hypothetical protein
MPVEQLSDIKALVTRLKSDSILRRSLPISYIITPVGAGAEEII